MPTATSAHRGRQSPWRFVAIGTTSRRVRSLHITPPRSASMTTPTCARCSLSNLRARMRFANGSAARSARVGSWAWTAARRVGSFAVAGPRPYGPRRPTCAAHGCELIEVRQRAARAVREESGVRSRHALGEPSAPRHSCFSGNPALWPLSGPGRRAWAYSHRPPAGAIWCWARYQGSCGIRAR
jgi:hypothetical protein